MPARSAAQAVSEYLEPLGAAVSCVTRRVLDNAGGYYPAERPHVVYFPGGSVELDMQEYGTPALALLARIQYRVVEDARRRRAWNVSIVAYEYSLKLASGPELLAYHWHPEPPSSYPGPPEAFVTGPHLHIESGTAVSFRPLYRAHLPTGYVTLQDVLRLAIRDLGVRSLRGDWPETLDHTQALMASRSAFG